MGQRQYSEQEMIQITSRKVHSFYERRPSELMAQMSEKFVWIGACDFQWAESLKGFREATKREFQEKEVAIFDEKYHVLSHSGAIWILYGRYHAAVSLGDGKVWTARVRVTFVWQQTGDSMQLLHIHGSHAQDYPIAPVPYEGDTGYFEYIKKMNFVQMEGEIRISRDQADLEYRIKPSEIIYLKAANQYCHVATKLGNFLVRGGIQMFEKKFPGFIRIHRCYLVNPLMIKSVSRYKVTLFNGVDLPVSQGRYTQVKTQLEDEAAKGKKLI